MSGFPYTLEEGANPRFGLIVLQADETIEREFRQMLPEAWRLLVSRVASGLEVTRETLQQMEGDLVRAASLFPRSYAFDVVGYGCTSGTAQIGADVVANRIQSALGKETQVTEPVSALITACGRLDIKRIAILSPYVEDVSDRLRAVLKDAGVASPAFGSFYEAEEARVARISRQSIVEAAKDLVAGADVDALFISCTNLRTMAALPQLREALGVPVLSSNQVLAWHMCALAGLTDAALELLPELSRES